jgi:hypothetical protein
MTWQQGVIRCTPTTPLNLLCMQVIGSSVGASLIPRAFPALQDLTLNGVQLADGVLFLALAAQASNRCLVSASAEQSSTSLRSLRLSDCLMTSTMVKHAAEMLGHLPGLQALHLTDTSMPTGFTAHLTRLSSLTIPTDDNKD